MQKYIVKEVEEGQTLFNYVKKVLKDAPMSVIYKLFRKKDVKVNGHWQKEKYIISANEEISIYLPDDKIDEFKKIKEVNNASNISSWIIYEDENVILINKPRGVLVQKDDSNEDALDDMVIAYLKAKEDYDPHSSLGFVPAPIHRLDRNTAGIIIFGKNLKTVQYLTSIINDKEKISKQYLTLVKGHIDVKGDIIAPLYKKSTHVEVNEELGKDAVTHYELDRYVNDFSLVRVKLLTGRTHQIRVHFSYLGHPVIGDKKYGDFNLNKEIEEKYGFKNQFLVAYSLEFIKLDGFLSYLSNTSFEIKLPQECLELLRILEDNKK